MKLKKDLNEKGRRTEMEQLPHTTSRIYEIRQFK